MAGRLQHDDDVYECDLDSVIKISTNEEEKEYHEESLFYDTDDGEDADTFIGDD